MSWGEPKIEGRSKVQTTPRCPAVSWLGPGATVAEAAPPNEAEPFTDASGLDGRCRARRFVVSPTLPHGNLEIPIEREEVPYITQQLVDL